MSALLDRSASSCPDCAAGDAPFAFRTAFQPIVDLTAGRPFAYEALVRGLAGEPAAAVLDQVTDANRYRFDQACRRQAIETAAALGLLDTDASLSINFLPNAMYNPDNCVRASLAAARRAGLPNTRIIFEVVEQERVHDVARLRDIFAVYRRHGFRNAIDDFGAGFAGFTLLAELPPDILKLDMALTRGIDASAVRRAIVAGAVAICRDLAIPLVAEGVETQAELAALRAVGVRYAQGYFLGPPTLDALIRVRALP